ncbi:NAD(P)-dependent alcohol dehydrogenase [Metabacillus litoralis]|uniref:NAD(P)-dependent alcohol dehydrogenase n=1 Tax=Metabacillus litoralis TaxID=152268 RepID=UPI000EF5C67E|nr:NAD(P)-dependent alcohol dehydrogenase [Metabacillus litoralis]
MKAIVQYKYGSPEVLNLEEVDKPALNDHQVLVKIHAASVNFGNLVLLKGKPYITRLFYGVLKPKHPIPGGDIAGCVEAVGSKVTQFKPGDEVFGDLSSSGWGAFAEYVSAPESSLERKPVNMSFEEAAAVPMAAVTALQGLRDKGKINSGQKVLIYGASGGVGTFAVQIAKAFGAEVTGVCSTRNIDILRTIGADYIIDYKIEGIDKYREYFDLIIGVNGHQPLSVYKRALKRHGIFVHVGGAESQLYQTVLQGGWISFTEKKKMNVFLQRANQKDLIFIKDLIESGKVKAVIDQQFELSEVPQALTYFAEGHAQGKVIITM